MNDTPIIMFGKYAGKPLDEVPASYLLWLNAQEWADKYPQILAWIDENLEELEDRAAAEQTDWLGEE